MSSLANIFYSKLHGIFLWLLTGIQNLKLSKTVTAKQMGLDFYFILVISVPGKYWLL